MIESLHIGPLRDRLQALAVQLRREDLSRSDKAVIFTQRALSAARLSARLTVSRQVLFELTEPPKVMRGLRDLLVRHGDPSDLSALSAVEQTEPSLIQQRFDRGDTVFIGQLEGEILCHAWFHCGPQPFEEDQKDFAAWELGRDTYWSYAAAATPQSKASGVFVKVFQTALFELFHEHGAQRVQCMVRHSNQRSVLLHERTGFRRLGSLTLLALPWVKWLHWEGPLASRNWLASRTGELLLPIPPVAPPASQAHA